MLKQRRFVISYLINSQPQSIDIMAESESMSDEEAKKHIEAALTESPPANLTDIYILDIHCSGDCDLGELPAAQSKN